jgi:hypothetical protein
MAEATNSNANGNGKALTDRNPNGRFLPGHRSLGGRKLGSRNRLSEKFIGDLQRVWAKKGAKALDRMADESPEILVRVVASLLPKQLDATLDVNVDIFAKARTRLEAYRLARDFIGAEDDEPRLIEAQASEVENEQSSN